MSKRIETAKQVLKDGGHFKYALERSYHGGEKFKTRLISANGQIVKSVGGAALRELKDSGFVARDYGAIYGSTACEIYRAA
jgi:hypothetical protein